MKKFLLNISFFAFIIALIFIIPVFLLERNDNHYFTMLSKKRTAFESIEGSRVLFIGDSNLAFGLDSKTISDSLRKPVINAGLHGGIGLHYMLQEYEDLVKSGDVVVLAPVYDQYYNGQGEYLTLPVALFYNNWHGISKLTFEQWKVFFSGYMQIIKQRNPNFSNEATYRASYFNEYGDEIKHWNMPSLSELPYMGYESGPINEEIISVLKKIIATWTTRGAVVYLAPPACTKGFYEENKTRISELQNVLKGAGLLFEFEPEQCAYDESYMYDGNYHLSKKGVDVYTSLMIRMLFTKD